MFVACGIWCLADVSSVSPSSEQTVVGLLHIGPININSVSSEKSTQSIVNKYGEIFNGVGKLKEFEMEIHIDPGDPG